MTKTTIAAALLFAARAYGDPAPTIELAVTGAIDSGVVATSIATELARPSRRSPQTSRVTRRVSRSRSPATPRP